MSAITLFQSYSPTASPAIKGGNRDTHVLKIHKLFSESVQFYLQLQPSIHVLSAERSANFFFRGKIFCQRFDKGGGRRGWNIRFLWQHAITGRECTPRLGWEEPRDLEKWSRVFAPARKWMCCVFTHLQFINMHLHWVNACWSWTCLYGQVTITVYCTNSPIKG